MAAITRAISAEGRVRSMRTFTEEEVEEMMDSRVCEKPQTNADRIRAMSDEELADILYSFQNLEDKVKFCMNKDSCTDILDGGDVIPDDMCKQCLLEYLQSEVEE